LAGVVLTDASLDQLETYYLLLHRWNRKINLTSLPLETMSDEALDRVVVEPLAAANAVRTSSLNWFDLGSGGGSPALPIKILRPAAQLTLVEARSRKAAFLREAVRELSLQGVAVLDERFEGLTARTDFSRIANLVTVRAVRIDGALFEASRHLLQSDGELLLFTTRGTPRPESPGFELVRVIDLLPGGSSQLHILMPG
jgi:16S rRNA (guanine527-N7)-methyltransferase